MQCAVPGTYGSVWRCGRGSRGEAGKGLGRESLQPPTPAREPALEMTMQLQRQHVVRHTPELSDGASRNYNILLSCRYYALFELPLYQIQVARRLYPLLRVMLIKAPPRFQYNAVHAIPLQIPQHLSSRRKHSPTPLVALHHLGDCVADGDACLLRLLLGQTRRHADLDGGRWLPSFVSRISPQAKRIGLESCDENAVGKTLLMSVLRP
jgi:hypothetical protein